MSKRKRENKNRLGFVAGIDPNSFVPQDKRFMKPVCHQTYENSKLKGSMLVQELDTVNLNRNRKATYFLPNNIALLLSTSEKALDSAKSIYSKQLTNPDYEVNFEKMDHDRKKTINEVSSIFCDYLENIQTAIVFGYTAIEAFVNISIPGDYQYTTSQNSRGISEIYDKKAIERWLTLKIKIREILTDIYKTSKVDKQKWWENFANLEKYRNDIIHQKSIDSTEFYKSYFKVGIFDICNSPIELIRFFHDSHAEKNKTNPIWPWVEGSTSIPINKSYDSAKFEVVGNLYKGIKKKY
ncbi:hypothetical protein HNV12_16850 [Methanococcoides sp. SA1]|nr:hypothetical protein [Methanococcoides sp. SA1]